MKTTATLTLILLVLLMSCQNTENHGTITGYETDSIYLYKAKGESTYNLTFLQSIPVANGKFAFNNDSLELGLYCFSLQNTKREEDVKDYAYLFMEPAHMDIAISKRENNDMRIYTSGSPINMSYMLFTEAKLQDENRLKYDSFDNVFYQAREMGDTVEMKHVKELAISYYDKAHTKLDELIEKQMRMHEDTYFAMYLYYTYRYQDERLNTPDEIAKVRNYINGFDEISRQSVFYKEMKEELDRFDKCAIGNEAPEITGTDIDDNPVRLSDFRGKYVLVVFWSSGCMWCRLEIPNMQKVYTEFKDKDFIILGVSFDNKKGDWINAIEKDKSHWDQVMLAKSDFNSTVKAYCILGIPHILLIDPEGIILAKELRGDEIYDSVKEAIESNQ